MARLRQRRHAVLSVPPGEEATTNHVILAAGDSLTFAMPPDEALRVGQQLVTVAARYDRDAAIARLTDAVGAVMRLEGQEPNV